MKGVLHPYLLEDMPAVAQWVSHAESRRRILKQNDQGLDDVALVKSAIEENVLVQIDVSQRARIFKTPDLAKSLIPSTPEETDPIANRNRVRLVRTKIGQFAPNRV